jgi:hypothetical protein
VLDGKFDKVPKFVIDPDPEKEGDGVALKELTGVVVNCVEYVLTLSVGDIVGVYVFVIV